jgi:AcrR family transcriptional regulator
MPKPEKISKRDATRENILTSALKLFREKGFELTTMRDIAKSAGLSLGASYYYFKTKEAIVMAYYDRVQAEHTALAIPAMRKAKDFRARLGVAMHTKLDIIKDDRRLLVALFRYGGDPDHPLSWFGPATKKQRELAMEIFEAAIGDEKLPKDVRQLAPRLLWTAHMGMILYFLNDKSAGQKKTRALVDGGLDLLVQGFSMSSIPMLQPMVKPIRSKIIHLLEDAELVPADAKS